MTIELELQVATSFPRLPSKRNFLRWTRMALGGHADTVLTIRLVDVEESRALNARYRGIDKATNVLSFSAGLLPEIGLSLLGDVVICAPLVESEALERGRDPMDHWAHLTVHGVLHLLGYDHQEDDDALKMESLEIRLLHQLGISDPYH